MESQISSLTTVAVWAFLLSGGAMIVSILAWWKVRQISQGQSQVPQRPYGDRTPVSTPSSIQTRQYSEKDVAEEAKKLLSQVFENLFRGVDFAKILQGGTPEEQEAVSAQIRAKFLVQMDQTIEAIFDRDNDDWEDERSAFHNSIAAKIPEIVEQSLALPQDQGGFLNQIRSRCLTELESVLDTIFENDDNNWDDEISAFKQAVADKFPELVAEILADKDSEVRANIIAALANKMTDYVNGDLT